MNLFSIGNVSLTVVVASFLGLIFHRVMVRKGAYYGYERKGTEALSRVRFTLGVIPGSALMLIAWSTIVRRPNFISGLSLHSSQVDWLRWVGFILFLYGAVQYLWSSLGRNSWNSYANYPFHGSFILLSLGVSLLFMNPAVALSSLTLCALCISRLDLHVKRSSYRHLFFPNPWFAYGFRKLFTRVQR